MEITTPLNSVSILDFQTWSFSWHLSFGNIVIGHCLAFYPLYGQLFLFGANNLVLIVNCWKKCWFSLSGPLKFSYLIFISRLHYSKKASGFVNTSTCQEGDMPQLYKDRSTCAQELSGPHTMRLFILLLIHILYYILVSVSRCLPESWEPFQQIIKPKKGVMEICQKYRGQPGICD